MTARYVVYDHFDLENFLVALRADGIKLSATADNPEVNGYLVKHLGNLEITLYDADAPERNIACLPGNLENYRNQIDMRVAQYNA